VPSSCYHLFTLIISFVQPSKIVLHPHSLYPQATSSIEFYSIAGEVRHEPYCNPILIYIRILFTSPFLQVVQHKEYRILIFVDIAQLPPFNHIKGFILIVWKAFSIQILFTTWPRYPVLRLHRTFTDLCSLPMLPSHRCQLPRRPPHNFIHWLYDPNTKHFNVGADIKKLHLFLINYVSI